MLATIERVGENAILHAEFAAVEQVKEIEALVGIDATNFSHALSNQSIAHVLREHGNAAVKRARGQLAVGKGDFAHLPEIVRKGQVSAASQRKFGPPRVKYVAEIDGVTFHYVAEVRARKRRLDMVSMWKK